MKKAFLITLIITYLAGALIHFNILKEEVVYIGLIALYFVSVLNQVLKNRKEVSSEEDGEAHNKFLEEENERI